LYANIFKVKGYYKVEDESLNYLELSKKADEKVNIGKIEEARSLLQKGLSQARKKGEKSYIEFFLGELEIIKGDYKSGLIHHKKAKNFEPKNPFLLKNLGVTYSLLGKENEAIELYDQALKIKPDDYNSLQQKGVSLSTLGKNNEAIELYDQALKIKPDDHTSLQQKGVSLSILGNNNEAIKFFDQALKIKPDDYDSLRQKGVSLSELGNYKEAIELYDQALKIKPDDWYALISKAYTLESKNKKKDANKIFKILQANLDKIKDREIIDFVNFKIGLLETKRKAVGKKEIEKTSDVLDKVINAFQAKKDDFFKSINEIESNFKKFTDTKRSIPEGFPSFLSVLRKWNSYTPIIPSEKGDNKGGGYFLYHRGKGIVIDPGFNFIENFYQEGFKVADIDAVLITHAHNDHTVDLEAILTLVYKHNDAIKDSVKEEMKDKDEHEIKHEIEKRIKEHGKKIDLFLNVGTFMKYSGWLNLKYSEEINNVTVLQPDTTYKLSEAYDGITIHTIKAKHHEIIDNKYAIGFILDIKGIKVGFTGDTGWDWENNGKIVDPFIEHKPKLIIAHLGSIKSQEFKYVEAKNEDERNECFYAHHLGLLGMTKFLDAIRPDLTVISEFGEELRQFRKEIVQRIGEVLGLKCLPGDIGLHIRLEDLGVYCFIENKFMDYKTIEVYSEKGDSTISFHRKENDHATFNPSFPPKNINHWQATPCLPEFS
jgi:tetratricopeptide (TPR) repeat protein/L-ascorbate metabolism protein UlaG (beta-lactamase superfamily)